MPLAVGDRKVCSDCRAELPLTAFGRNRAQPDGLANQCHDCLAASRKRWNEQNPEYYQAWRNGLSASQYKALVKAQGGECAVCKRAQKHPFRRLHVDHDHVTGNFRSLLCHSCNAALGQVQDDPVILRALADYIERHRAGPVELPAREDRIRARGESHGMARLTEMQVREIRALAAGGMKQAEVGARFGITQAMVSMIVLRKSWKHLPDEEEA
jgi:hypothetical protein